jgi:hypothetical protein
MDLLSQWLRLVRLSNGLAFSGAAQPRLPTSAAMALWVDRSTLDRRGKPGMIQADMHPRATNLQRQTRDVHELGFEPAGVPLPATNTQGQPLYRLSILPSLGAALHVPNQS